MKKLDGKVAIVTGSGRHKGLGQAIAKKLASEGARLVISDIGQAKDAATPSQSIGTTSEMEEVAEEIRAIGAEVSTQVCDVREEGDMEALVGHAVSQFGGIDIMVNNAGIGYLMGPLTDVSQDEWDAVLNVNLRGCFFGLKHAARRMIDQGRGGRIVQHCEPSSEIRFPVGAPPIPRQNTVLSAWCAHRRSSWANTASR